MAKGIEKGVHQGRAALPWALERHPDSDRLLVLFPRLRVGETRPPTGRRRFLQNIAAHRLYLGSDEHTYVGPQRSLAGLDTAVELIGSLAPDLSVPPAHVACMGTSSGGILALTTGLRYGAGRILAGAPPLKAGTTFSRFLRGTETPPRGVKASAELFVELARSPDGGDPFEWYDHFIYDCARDAHSPCRIDLLVSSSDYTEDALREFVEVARQNPVLECELHLDTYYKHAGIGDAFYPFLQQRLA